jgi:predicted nucleic acid-binding Zn ribbon protein
MTLEDRYFEIKNDPKKRVRAFKIIVVVAYSMLVLGAVLILWALYNTL